MLLSENIEKLREQINDDSDTFSYSEARKINKPWIQEAIVEYDKLSREEKEKIPLLYYILGDSTPTFKMSKEDARYTDKSNISNQACATCEFIYLKLANKKHICSQIRGHIKLSGWCRLWKKAENEE